MADNVKELDAYNVELSAITPNDVGGLHELSMSVRWPHRAEDWANLIEMGQGVLAKDALARIVCSMMWFQISKDVASIGMAISTPRLQELGAGRWLAKHILQSTGSRQLILVATKDSLRLCVENGFHPINTVFHINGVISYSSLPNSAAQPMCVEDRQSVIALDRNANGYDRSNVLTKILDMSDGVVLKRETKIVGYALCRKFGRGRVIGPIVAESQQDAIALITPFIHRFSGEFLRIDTVLDGGPLRQFLLEIGLRVHETATQMSTRPLPVPKGEAIVMGMASQAIG